MEIFTVSRQLHQHLGIIPYASKPAPSTIPVGTRITFPEFGPGDWVCRGSYYAPISGRCVLKRKNLQAVSGPYPTLAEVPNAFDNFIIPDDLLQSPGCPTFEVRVQGRRNGTLSAAQGFQLSVGTAAASSAFGATTQTLSSASSAVVRLFGYTTQISSSGNYQTSGIDPFNDGGVMPGGTITFANLSGAPIRLYARNGSTDSSETWAFHYSTLILHLW